MTVSQPSTSTVYRFVLPARKADATATAPDAPPSAADIQKLLDRIAPEALVSGATPTTVAGQGAYDVRVAPAQNGGLLGAVELAWDAARGVPLRVGIYARGASDPTLELAVTDISYGAVSTADIAVPPPAGAKVQTIDLSQQAAAHGDRGRRRPRQRDGGPGAGRGRVPAPRPRHRRGPGARVGPQRRRPGRGQRVRCWCTARGSAPSWCSSSRPIRPSKTAGKVGGLDLPTVSIGGASGTELATSLGTIARVTKGGVSYTVLGSVPAAAIEAAARDLVA